MKTSKKVVEQDSNIWAAINAAIQIQGPGDGQTTPRIANIGATAKVLLSLYRILKDKKEGLTFAEFKELQL